MKNAARSKQAGFTLLELMITVAVVAILSAIAYGSYRDQVMKSRRSAAAVCLMERAQFMERFYTTNMTYLNAPAPAACDAAVNAHYNAPSFNGTPTARAYSLQIVPRTGGVQANQDTKCATLRIDQAGVRSVTGTSSSTPTDCW